MRDLKPGTTVVVAMSGGVDSSVAAAFLLQQGMRVIGVTMKTYDFEDQHRRPRNETSCCGLGAVHDAKMVAAGLAIPHYTLDLRKEFEHEVIDVFVSEYMRGRTPNPCIACNREIKWGALLGKAESLGASYLATGHYARIRHDPGSGRMVISRARYHPKDQSYALWSVPQEALARTLFPLGEMTKPEVRTAATGLGLRTADKQESFDICFVEDNDYTRFLTERDPSLAQRVAGGPLQRNGQVVGQHRGTPFYTIGQRKGIGAHGGKMYVTGLDADSNTVRIGPDADLWRSALNARSVYWSGWARPNAPVTVTARVRYSDEATEAVVTMTDGDSAEVRFTEPKRAITPGQSVVFYHGDDLVGGGIIDTVHP
ncbi:MAG: tRNA 2-thiouridine(34) synthase MnmA [Bacteroidota bacterium]